MNFDRVFELIQFAIGRSGMKGIVTLGVIFVMWKMAEANCANGTVVAVCMTAVTLGFFIFRNMEYTTNPNAGGEKCPTKESTSS